MVKKARARSKNSVTARGVYKLTRYANGQHFETDASFNDVYNGDTRYSRLSVVEVDGCGSGWSGVMLLLEQAAKDAPLGSKVRISVTVE